MKKTTRKSIAILVVSLFLMASLLGCSQGKKEEAKPYPNKNIEWVIPYGAGGSTDLAARMMSGSMAQTLGVTIVPVNKAGGGGIAGADYLVQQPAGGYTIFTGNTAQNGIQLAMDSTIKFKNSDFTFISLYLTQDPLIVVKADSPFKTVDDLIKAAKEKPDTITYATSGAGTSLHISAELFQMATGTRLKHVPFKSGPEQMAALLGGHVSFSMNLSGDAKSMIESGKIRALATTAPQRIKTMSEVPTMAELGFKDCVLVSWHGIVGPKGMPAEVVDKLDQAAKKALEDPSVLAMLNNLGVSPKYMGHEEFAKFVKDEEVKLTKVVEKAGLRK